MSAKLSISIGIAWLACAAPASAQPPIPTQLGKNHTLVKRAFSPVIAAANRSTVRLLVQDRDVSLATVVSSDGFLLSVLGAGEEPLAGVVCRFPDGRQFAARRVASRPQVGLALWKIEAAGLVPVAWSETGAPRVGTFVATAGRGEEPVAIGIVSEVPVANVAAGSIALAVFSHDAILRPVDCGGPLVDLTGRAAGVNLARLSRALSRGIPAAAARQAAAEMIAEVQRAPTGP